MTSASVKVSICKVAVKVVLLKFILCVANIDCVVLTWAYYLRSFERPFSHPHPTPFIDTRDFLNRS